MKTNFIMILLALGLIFTSCESDNPVAGEASMNFTQVSKSQSFSIGLTVNMNVYAWGVNVKGVLGAPENVLVKSDAPVKIEGLSGIKQVAAGNDFALAVSKYGEVYVWGNNENGQLGVGSKNYYLFMPEKNKFLNDVEMVVAGDNYGMALSGDGFVYSWGRNEYGRLGHGITDECIFPKVVFGLEGIKKLTLHGNSCMALDYAGNVWTWGENTNNILGRNDEINNYEGLPPAQLDLKEKVRSIGVDNGMFYATTLTGGKIKLDEFAKSSQGH